MLKHKKTLLGSILMLLVVVGVCFYFSQKKRPDPESVRIYSAATPALKNAPPEASHEEKHTHVTHTHAESHPKPEGVSTLEHSEEVSRLDNVKTSETLHKRTAEEAEKTVPSVLEGISEEEATLWVQEQIGILGDQMAEKYPEIARIAHLTPDEYDALYSTDEAKDAILELALQAKDEFFADFQELFLMLPRDVGEAILDGTHKLFTKNWGAEKAGTIISEIRAEMGL